jgi:hypothetical protein
MADLVDRYLACWNETDPDARRTLIAEHWTDQLHYLDPLTEIVGRSKLDATIAATHEQFPGFVFAPYGPADAHERRARFGWGFGPRDAEPVVIGFDVVLLDDDGRFDTVVGFLDKVPG